MTNKIAEQKKNGFINFFEEVRKYVPQNEIKPDYVVHSFKFSDKHYDLLDAYCHTHYRRSLEDRLQDLVDHIENNALMDQQREKNQPKEDKLYVDLDEWREQQQDQFEKAEFIGKL